MTVDIFSAETFEVLQSFTEFSDPVKWVALSCDGLFMATFVSNEVLVWDTTTCQAVSILQTGDKVGGIEFNPHFGDHLVIKSVRTMDVWDWKNNQRVWEAQIHVHDSEILKSVAFCCSYSADGQRIKALCQNSTLPRACLLNQWNAFTGERIDIETEVVDANSLRYKLCTLNMSLANDVNAVAYSNVLVVFTDTTLLRTHRAFNNIVDMRFSFDGTRIAASDMRGAVVGWDVFIGALVFSFQLHLWAKKFSFTPDGSRLVCGTTVDETKMGVYFFVFDLESNKVVHKCPGPAEKVLTRLAFSSAVSVLL